MAEMEPPASDYTKDELWLWIRRHVKESNQIRRVFLAHVAAKLADIKNPYHGAVEKLFAAMDAHDPTWRMSFVGLPDELRTALGEAWEKLSNIHNEHS